MCINSDIEACEVAAWLYFSTTLSFYKFNCDRYSKGDCRKNFYHCAVILKIKQKNNKACQNNISSHHEN